MVDKTLTSVKMSHIVKLAYINIIAQASPVNSRAGPGGMYVYWRDGIPCVDGLFSSADGVVTLQERINSESKVRNKCGN